MCSKRFWFNSLTAFYCCFSTFKIFTYVSPFHARRTCEVFCLLEASQGCQEILYWPNSFFRDMVWSRGFWENSSSEWRIPQTDMKLNRTHKHCPTQPYCLRTLMWRARSGHQAWEDLKKRWSNYGRWVGKFTQHGREAQGQSWQMPLLVEMGNRRKEKEKSLSFLPLALGSVSLAAVVLLPPEQSGNEGLKASGAHSWCDYLAGCLCSESTAECTLW